MESEATQLEFEKSNWKPPTEILRIDNVTPGSTLSFATINPPKIYDWKPRYDITAYELALLAPLLLLLASETAPLTVMISNLPEDAKRHLEEVEQLGKIT